MDTNNRFDLEEKKDTWSEEMCIQLINAYRQHPVLYDPRNPFFYKKYAKIAAWNDIGESQQRSARECKHKMNILLSSFRRQKSKFRRGNMTVSKWFGYQHLKFLLLINKDEHSMYRMLSNDSDDTRSVISTEDCDEGQPEVGTIDGTHDNKDIETLIVTEDDFIKTENESDMDDDIDVNSAKKPCMLRTLLSEPIPQTIQDKEIPEPSKQMRIVSTKVLKVQEIDAFTKFVNSKLRKYSSKTVCSIQREICEILFKADHELHKRYQS